MKQIVLRFASLSNSAYKYEYETGYSPEEWEVLSDADRSDILQEALWADIDIWEEGEVDE